MVITHTRRLLLVTGLALAVFAAAWSEHERGSPRVVVLDVGQGDAIYVRTPSGQDVLIDSGRGSEVVEQLSQQLPLSDRTIELAIATHFDADHAGGFEQVLSRYRVERFATNGATPTTETGRNLVAAIKERGVEAITLQRGARIEGPGYTLDVLWPVDSSDSSNDGSVIVILKTATQSVLLTGDADSKVEAALLEAHQPLVASVLKVGHHGSKTSSSTDFLEAVAGTQAAISVGERNSYGHPTKEALERLGSTGYQIKRTDESGPLTYPL